MRKIWHDDAWDDYLYWQGQDTTQKIRGRGAAAAP